MQLSTLTIFLGLIVKFQNVMGAPLIVDFEEASVFEAIGELDYLEDGDVGIMNSQQDIGTAGGGIANINAQKSDIEESIYEFDEDLGPELLLLADEEDEREVFVLGEEGEREEEFEEIEEMDIDITFENNAGPDFGPYPPPPEHYPRPGYPHRGHPRPRF